MTGNLISISDDEADTAGAVDVSQGRGGLRKHISRQGSVLAKGDPREDPHGLVEMSAHEVVGNQPAHTTGSGAEVKESTRSRHPDTQCYQNSGKRAGTAQTVHSAGNFVTTTDTSSPSTGRRPSNKPLFTKRVEKQQPQNVGDKAKVETLQTMLNERKAKNEVLTKEKEELEKTNEALEADKTRLQDELESERAKRDVLRSILSDMNAVVERLRDVAEEP